MAFSSMPFSSAAQQQQRPTLRYGTNQTIATNATKALQPRANGLLGPCQPFLAPASAARARFRIASEGERYKTHAAVQQRHGVSTDTAQHHGQQHNSHSHHVARSTSDDSLRIIMLLSLSLTLMLLPWMSRHPEFLIAPVLLAITPVVGNGVRPVLKEVGAGLLTTIRLSLGLLARHEQQQQHLPGSHHHYHGHNQQHSHSHNQHGQSSSHRHQQQQQQAASSPWPNPHIQQQQQHPAGPYSPWPHPTLSPAPWSPTGAAAAAADSTQVQGRLCAVGAVSDGTDTDWTPSSPPDPHQADPHSQQHLQQVLAADKQAEQELSRPEAAAAAAAIMSSIGVLQGRHGSPNTSPAGSPVQSVDSAAGSDQVLSGNSMPVAASGAAGANSSGHHHHHHHARDPRVLSKAAKQQLYHSQQQQHRQ